MRRKELDRYGIYLMAIRKIPYFAGLRLSISARTGAIVFVLIERRRSVVSLRQYWIWASWKLTISPKQNVVIAIRQ